MLRTVLAVIAGYLVMFVCVFVSFTAAYLLMGADGAFLPGSYEVSLTWLAASFVLGLLAALVGGIVCAKIAPAGRAPDVLAVLVLVLALASALFTMLHFSVISAPYLFAVGMLLGWTKYRTGSLYPSILLHFLHNYVVVEFF